ncbi:hypothetical protein PENSPDRAFT_680379 [Peniophora sp. CONT]|nr:hypothetical protein PENSPDRAFT_680379 [Peniophora sp. CONT]
MKTLRLFALVIGINEYQDVSRNLAGAVNDAQRIKTLLLSQHPPVSEDRIIFLRNRGATANAIIKCLQYLCVQGEDEPARDGRVKDEGKEKPSYGDPILIYYAGHGSTLPKPEGWTSENPRIQCLSPHDARIGADNSVINVIPDRTFGALLEQLAEAKGNNITVILDCCHSGSGTRNDAVPRGMEFKDGAGTELTISSSYQRDIWVHSQRGVAYLPKFANAGLTSHVVLAACGPDESAYEDRIKHEGRFTSAFLSVLETAGTDTLTYAELIRRLDYLPSQTPRCEGRDKDVRILFDAGLKQRDRDYYDIEIRSQSSSTPYLIHAGQIHGVGKDDVFAVYVDRESFVSGGESLGSLVVQSVTSDSCFASPIDGSLNISDTSRAVASISRVKSPDAFRVNVNISEANYPQLRQRVLDALKQVVHESAESTNTTGPSDSSTPRVAAASASSAAISIIPSLYNTVLFVFQDGLICDTLGLERLCGPVKADTQTLIYALRSAAHFFRHLGSSPLTSSMLGKSPSTSKILLRDHVDVRICELEGSVGISNKGVLVTQLQPTGDFIDTKLCGMFQPTLSHVSDPDPTQTLYSVDVRNKSGLSLYVWLFYFDCSTLQIIEYYSPPVVSGRGDAPLPPLMKAALPLNYGDAGGVPLAFEVPEGQKLDGGFLRVFLSTRHINLSNIVQDAVVRPGEPMGAVIMKDLVPVADLWDAITIAVKLEEPRLI